MVGETKRGTGEGSRAGGRRIWPGYRRRGMDPVRNEIYKVAERRRHCVRGRYAGKEIG